LRHSSIDLDSAVRIEASAGVSEVVVYTADHQASFANLPETSLELLGAVWCDRYQALSRRPDVRYVFIFENRGEAVGVTLHHPHGQIYAYPFVPPVPTLELSPDAEEGGCQQCRLLEAERRAGVRLLQDTGEMLTYVPAYARWSYEVHVAPRAHRTALPDLDDGSRLQFMRQLQSVARAYDRLFEVPMPYMMVIHQAPAGQGDHPQAHLHAEFYPLLRDRGKLKYLAGAESGVGTFLNDAVPEESAARLREFFDVASEQAVETRNGPAQLERDRA
jgi:UDPglucose--hexose-1-phosphate uridylyltransferase